jgi:hypothetical protein
MAPEYVPEMGNIVPVVTQDDEFGADEEHLPSFGTKAESYGFNEEEAREQADREFGHFSRDVLGNSSAEVSDDSDVPQGRDTIVMSGDTRWVKITDEGVKTYEQIFTEMGFSPGPVSNDEVVHMAIISEGLVDSPAAAPHAWSSSFARVRREAIQLQAIEEQFSFCSGNVYSETIPTDVITY